MPLSEEEARLLHQLEQSLAAEDPDFASTLRGSKQAARNRRLAAVAGVGFAAGIVVLFVGALSAMAWIGVVGFVVMLATAYLFVRAWRGGLTGVEESPSARGSSGPGSAKAPKQSGGSFVDRMEERWQRRQDGDDR